MSAFSESGTALVATSPGNGGTAKLGLPTGQGIVAMGSSASAAYPVIQVLQNKVGTDAIGVYGQSGFETFVIQASSANASGEVPSSNAMDVQSNGDLYVSGRVFETCTNFPETNPEADCQEATTGAAIRTASGADVRTYAAHESLPTVEDFGTAALVNGRGFVALDPAFARTISTSQSYLVFVTPRGASRGLFVDARSSRGFEVLENPGGRSNLTFDYRIVAKPYADDSARFPLMHPHVSASVAKPDPFVLSERVRSLGRKLPAMDVYAPILKR